MCHHLQTIVEQGGLQPGGLNFDAKVRRESTDLEDLFIAHIGAMDAFARGLRNAVSILEDGLIPAMLKVCPPPGRCFAFVQSRDRWCLCRTGALLQFQPWSRTEGGGRVGDVRGDGGKMS